jgi:hypothetical protein
MVQLPLSHYFGLEEEDLRPVYYTMKMELFIRKGGIKK